MAEKQLFHTPICKNEEQQIEEQRLVVPPCMPNILQDFGDYKQHETNEEEDADSMFGEISEPTLPLSSTEIEIIGNNICETLQGEDPFLILPHKLRCMMFLVINMSCMLMLHLYLCHNKRMRFMFPILIHILLLKLSICCPLHVKMMS